MPFGPFDLRSRRSIRKRFLGTILLFVGLPAAFLFCCVCGPIISLFVESDMEKAAKLWDEGKQAEAVEIYSVALPNAMRPDPLGLKRAIEWSWQNGDEAQAIRFCELAAEKDVKLSLSPPELHERYEEALARYQESETRRLAEEAEKRKHDEAKKERTVDKIAAWVAAQRYVEDRIENLAAADFGAADREYQDPDERVTKISDELYEVTGWVDAVDEIGQTTRYTFRVRLIPDSAGADWKLLDEPIVVPQRKTDADAAPAAPDVD